MNSQVKKWTLHEDRKLISIYKKYPSLWNHLDEDYDCPFKNESSLFEMYTELEEYMPAITLHDIKTRIKQIHKQVVKEKEKIAEFINNYPHREYESSLTYFKQLSFLFHIQSDNLKNSWLDDKSDIEIQHINSTNETEDEIEASPEECIANVSKTNLRENENNPLQELATKKIPKKKTKSNDSVIDELRQTAAKSLELMNLFMRTRIEEREKEDSKEEAFCRMLCAELKGFKYENTYDQVTTELFALVRQAKANERELLTQNL